MIFVVLTSLLFGFVKFEYLLQDLRMLYDMFYQDFYQHRFFIDGHNSVLSI